jgi:sugar phosphate isomerase/epimerase
MWGQAHRWLSAASLPGPVASRSLPGMDVLQADGSIRWSEAHLAEFTPERTRREVERAVAARQALELAVDPAAVTALDRLLGLLTERGVRVVLIHPPFNPAFYRAIEHTAYGAGLRRLEALTRRLGAAHGAPVVGSFDPAAAGCTEAMYIDAEHSRPACLARVLRQVPGL